MSAERLQDALAKYQQIVTQPEKNPYVSTPEQLRALQLATLYDDQDHKIRYLNLCRRTHPAIIEQAASFVADAQAHNKGALFMWKVKEIRAQWEKQGKDCRHPSPKAPPKKTSSRRSKRIVPASLFD